MRYVQSAAFAAIGFIALAPAAVNAQATVTSTPIVFAIANPCNGEPVVFQGTLHTVAHAHFDASGGAHAVFNLIVQATGVGFFSGDKYVATSARLATENISLSGSSGAWSQSTVFRFRANGLGQVPDFDISQSLHFTINSNGLAVVVDHGSAVAECR